MQGINNPARALCHVPVTCLSSPEIVVSVTDVPGMDKMCPKQSSTSSGSLCINVLGFHCLVR